MMTVPNETLDDFIKGNGHGVAPSAVVDMARELLHLRQCIPVPLSCEHGGKVWRAFVVEFDSDDIMYTTYIHAVSKEHASYRLEHLKETGRLADGELVGIYPRGDE